MKLLRRRIGETLFQPTINLWVNRMSWFLSKQDRILDLGAGTCLVSHMLLKRGYQVTSVDVVNKSYYPHIVPQIYDGLHLSYNKNYFSVCLLLAVLHHAVNPAETLAEAVKVSRKLIILEDLIESPLQEKYTHMVDRILNKEFNPPPHNNKTDKEWREVFTKAGLKIIKTDYTTAYLFVKHATYYLEKV